MDCIDNLLSRDIHGINLYLYCGQDPVNNVDPNGNLFFTALLVGAGVGFAVSFASSVISQSILKGGLGNVNYGVALVDGLFGAVSGALAVTTLNPLATGLIDAGLTIANGYITTGMENKWEYTATDHIAILFSGALSFLCSYNGKKDFIKSGGLKKLEEAKKLTTRLNNGTYQKKCLSTRRINNIKIQKNNILVQTFFNNETPKSYLITFLQSVFSVTSPKGLEIFN